MAALHSEDSVDSAESVVSAAADPAAVAIVALAGLLEADEPIRKAPSEESTGCPKAAALPASSSAAVSPSLDLEAWKGDLQKLHGTIDQVVQSFISSQTRQLDVVAAELASQRERIVLKEERFTTLSDSIAGFVEEEAKRLEECGIALNDPEADARHEAYDAELPGAPALHRINRLWRKATRAFEAAREAEEIRSQQALAVQRSEMEAKLAEAEQRLEFQKGQQAEELKAMEARLQEVSGEGAQASAETERWIEESTKLSADLEVARAALAEKVAQLQDGEATKARAQYEREAERECLAREGSDAQSKAVELERALADAAARERELKLRCDEQVGKLEEMRKVMDDQERELTQKIDRVQQYVKERQTNALHAEKKQQDAERLAERWQSEVRRLQADKDKLAALVLDLEGRQSGQSTEFNGAMEKHRQEVSDLKAALRQKEEDMRAANLELLQQRDNEYQAKVNAEKQREKDRSIALLRKKEQEVHIKDQQLKAAKQRIQDLEASLGSAAPPAAVPPSASTSPGSTSRGGSSVSSLARPQSGGRRGDSLPPLSAR